VNISYLLFTDILPQAIVSYEQIRSKKLNLGL